MTTDIAGIERAKFEAPVEEALVAYSDKTGGELEFDIAKASDMKTTLGFLGYSGVSTSFVHYGSERIGHMEVFALAPGDATGSESPEYPFSVLGKEGLERYLQGRSAGRSMTQRLTPRPKGTKDYEVVLAIAAFQGSDPNALLFANNLTLLEIPGEDKSIRPTGTVGQERHHFLEIVGQKIEAEPTATLTAGTRVHAYNGRRFGDPSALLNAHPPYTQVAGVLTLNNGDNDVQQEIIAQLQASAPAGSI